MKTLGVNGASDTLYLAVAEDGEVVDVAPYHFAEPSGLPAGKRFAALRADAEKTVRALKVDRVRILDGEPTYRTTMQGVQTRIALETLFALGAADAGIDCDRLSRAKARSLLGLPRKGELVGMVSTVTPRVGPHWSPRKRDLAALAAIAADRN